MRALPLLFLILAACGPSEDPPPPPLHGYDYAPNFGETFHYLDPTTLPDFDDTDMLHLRVLNGSWELKRGVDLETGVEVQGWNVEVNDEVGVTFDGQVVLPADFYDGDTWDNGEILGIEEEDKVGRLIWPEVVRVQIDGGPAAGPGAFVVGIGMVELTVDGVTWTVNEYETL